MSFDVNEEYSEISLSNIEFTIGELWILQGSIRHDEKGISNRNSDKYPLKVTYLNEEIARAIAACINDNLDAYVLSLNYIELLCIDANVGQESKNKQGGRGEDILIKICNARRDRWLGPSSEEPIDASRNTNEDTNEDTD